MHILFSIYQPIGRKVSVCGNAFERLNNIFIECNIVSAQSVKIILICIYSERDDQ